MEFLPYDATLLRCHPNREYGSSPLLPMAAFLRSSDCDAGTTINTRQKIEIACCVCGSTYVGQIVNLSHSTNQCTRHKNRRKNRHCYQGEIPEKITRAIRAGLLRRIETESLVSVRGKSDGTPLWTLVRSLLPGAAPESSARAYVQEVATFDTVTLADNCFWRASGKRKRTHGQRPTLTGEDLVRAMASFVLDGGNLCALLHTELRRVIGDDGAWRRAMGHTKDAATQTPVTLEPALQQDVRILHTLLDSVPALDRAVASDAVVTAIGGGGVAIVYHQYKWTVRMQGADGDSVIDNPFTEHFPLTQRAYHDTRVTNALVQPRSQARRGLIPSTFSSAGVNGSPPTGRCTTNWMCWDNSTTKSPTPASRPCIVTTQVPVAAAPGTFRQYTQGIRLSIRGNEPMNWVGSGILLEEGGGRMPAARTFVGTAVPGVWWI